MKDCKRCDLWKLLLIMAMAAVLALSLITLGWATHDPPSKRLDFAPVAEYHLGKAAAGREMRAEARRLCPFKLLTPDCTWVVTFYAKNPDGPEDVISYAVFSMDLETTALGCMLKYTTVNEELLVDRFLDETVCGKGFDGAV